MNNTEIFKKYENLALDITSSVWISASAGGGKTSMIVKRILKLLLFSIFEPKMFHVEHSQIVILTYTNEASNEIRSRIRNKFYEWYSNNEILIKDLEFFGINCSTWNNLKFAEESVLDGTFSARILKCKNLFKKNAHLQLKIKSFHAFSLELIQRYQIESGLEGSSNISVICEKTSRKILDKIIENYFIRNKVTTFSRKNIEKGVEIFLRNTECSAWNIYDMEKSLKTLFEITTIQKLNKSVEKFFSTEKKQVFGSQIIHKNKGKKLFHVEQFIGLNNVLEYNLKVRNCSTWNNFFDQLYSYQISKNKFKNCSTWNNSNLIILKKHFNKEYLKIESFLQQDSLFYLDKIHKYKSIFFTKEHIFRKIFLKNKKILQILIVVSRKINDILELENNIKIVKKSVEFFKVINKINIEYIEQKTKKKSIDFSDILSYADHLLEKSDYRTWILYQLSKQIKHFIVDEAQDSSAKQWNFLKNIADNILQSSDNSTLFVVGDIKQSIYSFQGAEPLFFDNTKQYLINKFKEYGKKFVFLNWNFSFRVPRGTLKYIDDLFNENNFSKNITLQEDEKLSHIYFNKFDGEIKHIVPCGTIRLKNFNKKIRISSEKFFKHFYEKITNRSIWNNLYKKIKNIKDVSQKFKKCSTWNISKRDKIFSVIYNQIHLDKIYNHNSGNILVLFRSKADSMLKLKKMFHVEHFDNQKFEKFKKAMSDEDIVSTILLINKILVKENRKRNLKNLYIHYLNKKTICRSNRNVPRGTFYCSSILGANANLIYKTFNCSMWNNSKYRFAKRKIILNFRQFSRLNVLGDLEFQFILNLTGNIKVVKNLMIKIIKLNNLIPYYQLLELILEFLKEQVNSKMFKLLKDSSYNLFNQNLGSILHFNNFLKNLDVNEKSSFSLTKKIKISTIHGSKGLEADKVILVNNVLEKTFNTGDLIYLDKSKKVFLFLESPYSQKSKVLKKIFDEISFKESCRLLYVALTRTKNRLILIQNS